jgi:hypothetical protein
LDFDIRKGSFFPEFVRPENLSNKDLNLALIWLGGAIF